MKIIYGVTLRCDEDKVTVIFGSEKRAAEFADFMEKHTAVGVSPWSKESK
jgi:hypothetical protein